MSATRTNPLRPIVHRLNNTAPTDLPRYVGFLSTAIQRYDYVFKDEKAQRDDIPLTLHKLRTRITGLLQDKSSEGRFSGLVLAKAVIDAGGVAGLASLTSWARILLSTLNKTDPFEVKKLALVTITRLFLLTTTQPSLIREVTTPVLPAFIQTCLSMIRPIEVPKTSLGHEISSPALETVLRCWQYLIPEFPSTFRPFLSSLKTISLTLLGGSGIPVRSEELVIDIVTLLPMCSPKNAVVSEWENVCLQTIQSSHQHANVIFRSVIEEWSMLQSQPESIGGKVASEPRTKAMDLLGMKKWSGLDAGAHRLRTLLNILARLIGSGQPASVTFTLASTLDLTGRLANISPPTSSAALRSNPEFSRDECEELWLHLPDIHIRTVEVLHSLIHTYDQALRPTSHIVTNQILAIFEAGRSTLQLRQAAYAVMLELLRRRLFKPSQSELPMFHLLVKSCCQDLEATLMPEEQQNQKGDNLASMAEVITAANAVANVQHTRKGRLDLSTTLSASAKDLLTVILLHAVDSLSFATRTQIDRIIILTGHTEAMLASVLHPASSRSRSRVTPSLLPFVARAGSAATGVECLLRPRLPLTRTDMSNTDQVANEEHVSSDVLPINPDDDVQSDVMEDPQYDAEVIQSTKKREYAAFHADLPLSNGTVDETNKKLREMYSSQDPMQVELPTTIPTTVEVSMEAPKVTQSSTIANETDAQQVTMEVEYTPGKDNNHAEVSKSSTIIQNKISTQRMVSNADADTSDDEEIPQIDMNLSDEESDDEDE